MVLENLRGLLTVKSIASPSHYDLIQEVKAGHKSLTIFEIC